MELGIFFVKYQPSPTATLGNLLHNVTTPDSESKRLGWLVSARLDECRVLVDSVGGRVVFLVFFTVRSVGACKAASSGVTRHSQPIVWHNIEMVLAQTCAQRGKAGAALLFSLTIALHGLLGGQDEGCETGEGLRQLQERMLSMEKENKQTIKERYL